MGRAIVRTFAAQGARVGFVNLLDDAGAVLASELQGQGAANPMTSQSW